MGADGSKLSLPAKREEIELLMQQTAKITQRFSQQPGDYKKRHGAMIQDTSKRILALMKAKNDEAAAQTKMIKIVIEDVTYDIIERIGQGGFGEVHKAQVRNKNRTVAIKIINNTPGIREEIENEVRFLNLTRKVPLDDHPVINYYGCKFTNERIYIAMELAFCDLAKFWINRVTQAEPETKLSLGIIVIVYVLRALTFLEQLNIIHGDIKPQNIVIIPGNECFYVKLIDFGTVEKMNTSRAHLTVDANKAYTVFFASPEFLRHDSNNVRARYLHKTSDAWAAGVLFYILFFDRLPWKDPYEYENFCNDPNARDVFIPAHGGYKRIIELLLKKDPEKRSSAKATLMQMKEHPALRDFIESLHETFCPVDDVCRMRVPDDVWNELGELARSSHRDRAPNSSFTRSLSGARRPCRYGRECYRKANDHREDFAHPGDSDYDVSQGASNVQSEKPKCRYGLDCYRTSTDHRNKYTHRADSDKYKIDGNGHCHSAIPKPFCGTEHCDTDPHHRNGSAYPNSSNRCAAGGSGHGQFEKQNCRYGAACYNMDPVHRSQYAHPSDLANGRSAPPKCHSGASCTK